jgi:hypothetical protein
MRFLANYYSDWGRAKQAVGFDVPTRSLQQGVTSCGQC